jgi:AraC-like DNA-binding protein
MVYVFLHIGRDRTSFTANSCTESVRVTSRFFLSPPPSLTLWDALSSENTWGHMQVIRQTQPPSSAPQPRPLTPTMLDGRVQKILQMVESGATHTINDLALEFHLSPSYLQRLFKHQTGVCMGEWLSEQRLQRAAHLLANSYMSVKEIAHTVGYEHVSSFIRAFERRFAQAPARYRKHNECTKC